MRGDLDLGGPNQEGHVPQVVMGGMGGLGGSCSAWGSLFMLSEMSPRWGLFEASPWSLPEGPQSGWPLGALQVEQLGV